MKSKTLHQLSMAGLVVIFGLCIAIPASAYPGGVSGYSGKSGPTCTMCHSTGAAPGITLSGPTTVSSGSTNTYTVSIAGATTGGLDVAASGGSFAAGTNTQVLAGEVTHTAASAGSWSFSWTAPTVTSSTTATIYAAGINSAAGGTGTLQKMITVTPPAPPPLPTMTVNPTSLSFSYTTGSANPAAKTFAVTSSGTAFAYTLSTGSTTWLMATGAGNTPGTVSVSVNPSGLAAGTYSGTVTVTSSGAANSPQPVPVTLTVTGAPPPTNPMLTINPSNLSFSYAMGGTPAGSKTIAVGSSGSMLAYTLGTTGGKWLSATGAGNTPGNVTVSVNTTGLSAGTYNGSVIITSTGASNSPQTVPVTLTVTATPPPPTGNGTLTVSSTRLVFYSDGSTMPGAKTISVSSSSGGTPIAFTAETYGGSWVSVTPSGGNTPGKLTVQAYPTGLPAGTYSCVLQIKGGRSAISVEVVLVVSYSGGGGGGDDGAGGSALAQPFTFDPGVTGSTNAQWVNGAGVPVQSTTDTRNQGLVLVKSNSGPPTAMSGAAIGGAAGSHLTRLGFDLRAGSECTAKAPQFVVITMDDVTHTVGCANGSTTSLPVSGWKRVRFSAAKLTPAVQPGATVKTVALVMDDIAGNGIAVLDNIAVNSTLIGRQ